MTCRGILALLIAGAVLTALVLVAGGYNVSAAAGHLPPVKAILHFTMRNSVSLRSGGPAPEDQIGTARALVGAGHYDLVCRDCHGAPGIERDAVAKSLVPEPPHILEAVRRWQASELFWIVKNGIKMTAMPAWPALHREDEVWSVVAFLTQLPDMDAAAYRRAVTGPVARRSPPGVAELERLLDRCARCHGYDGRGTGARAVPRLDGLSAGYLENALRAYATGKRASGIMQTHASAVPAAYLDDLARHYAGAEPAGRLIQRAEPSPLARTATPDADRGSRLARRGAPERRVPPCADCHGPAPYPRSSAYPALAGQSAEFLETQLRLFRQGVRGGSPFADIMRQAAEGLDEEDIVAVSRYYAELESDASR